MHKQRSKSSLGFKQCSHCKPVTVTTRKMQNTNVYHAFMLLQDVTIWKGDQLLWSGHLKSYTVMWKWHGCFQKHWQIFTNC